jgi:hypothetical protein
VYIKGNALQDMCAMYETRDGNHVHRRTFVGKCRPPFFVFGSGPKVIAEGVPKVSVHGPCKKVCVHGPCQEKVCVQGPCQGKSVRARAVSGKSERARKSIERVRT